MSQQSFVSLLQVCSRLSRLEDLVLLLALVATTYFCCDHLLSFSLITLSRQYFVHFSNSYVATSIIMSQHSFSAASVSYCCDPGFHVMTTSLFRLCCNIVLYYLHFYRDPESLSRQRLVATVLDFLLQLRSYVATCLLDVVNVCCRDLVFMLREGSSVFNLLVLLKHSLLCRDRTFLHCVEFFVAT